MRVINRKPFYWGVGLTCTLIFVYICGADVSRTTWTSKDINSYSVFGKGFFLIPGILLLLNGLYPNSRLGRVGGLTYELFSWIFRK